MKARPMTGRSVLWVLLVAWGLWGCAGQPFDPPQADEIPKGPGVFTKDEGGLVLYDSDRLKPQQPAAEKRSAVFPAVVDPSSATTDYEAFEAYKRWRLWKKSAMESGEYEEFQQWREWEKYKEWKKGRARETRKE